MKNLPSHVINGLKDEQKNIIRCIGIESYCKLTKEFGGTSIYVATPDIFDRTERNEHIIEDIKKGVTINQIAIKYGLTAEWVRKIKKEYISENR